MNLAEYIATHEKSANSFSKRTGISQSSLSRILNGKQKPSLEMAEKLSRATNGKVSLLNILYPGEANVEKTKVSVFRDVGRKVRKLFRGV